MMSYYATGIIFNLLGYLIREPKLELKGRKAHVNPLSQIYYGKLPEILEMLFECVLQPIPPSFNDYVHHVLVVK